MKIIGYGNKNAGPAFHRIFVPLRHMEGVETFMSDEPKEEDFDNGCDIVFYNRRLSGPETIMVQKMRDKLGFKICVDLDDHWDLGKNHTLYNEETNDKIIRFQLGHIAFADLVIVTHERLAKEAAAFNKNVYICPNAITRKEEQFNIQTKPHDKVRMFWQGSNTHLHDIGILNDPISKLIRMRSKMEMIIGGVEEKDPDAEKSEPNDVWMKMIKDYTGDYSFTPQYILGTSVDKYYKLYENADVCLVPLIHNKFNRFKSNIKVLEAANLGLPVVASQVHPYLRLPVSYCMRSSDWVEHIKLFVNNKSARENEGAKLAEFANEHFNFDKINKERQQILEYAASKQGVS